MKKSKIEDAYLASLKQKYNNHIFKYDLYNDDNEHDHCLYCWARISRTYDDSLRSGYHTLDAVHWFCSECFNKYKDILGLVLYDSSIFDVRYNNILDLLDKELMKYDNRKMYDLIDLKCIFKYFVNIHIASVNVRITPYIYDNSKKKILMHFDDLSKEIESLDYLKLKSIVNYYDSNKDLHKIIDDSNSWKSIMLLFEEIL